MGVDASAVARVVGIETKFRDLRQNAVLFLPQRIAVVGQGSTAATYDTTKAQFTSAIEVGQTYGFGSPLHLAALQLLPINGDGVGTLPVTFYPLEDEGGAVAATGDIIPTGPATANATFFVVVSGIRSVAFTAETGDVVADLVTKATDAINATVNLPVTAVDNVTDVQLTSKWAGTSANDITVAIEGPTDAGIVWAVTEPAGGATNPDITPALAQVGDVWETMIVNALGSIDSVALDAYQTFGEGRWGVLTKKPLVVFTGANTEDFSGLTAITEARADDRINVMLPAPGSPNLPVQIAARAVARVAVQANNNPPVDYARRRLTNLTPGADSAQWDYLQRDTAIKAGSSSTVVRDGVIELSDTVTMQHPVGDPLPPYRYVVDIVKLQNVIFNINLIFESAEWDGAPLVPDDQPVSNRAARQPKAARSALAAMVDSLADEAIISDPSFSKNSMVVEIDDMNPKRLNVELCVKLSGNANIVSVDLCFGFFFGGAAAA